MGNSSHSFLLLQVIESMKVISEVKYLGALISKDLLRREEINTNRIWREIDAANEEFNHLEMS